jgi:hypothetical protein
MRLSKITLATLLSLASVAGFAADTSIANVSGVYAQLGAGYGNNNTTSLGSNVKQTGFLGNLGVGYIWALPDKFAAGVELSSTLYPKTTSSPSFFESYSLKATSYSINLLAVGKYFLDDKFSFVAKFGPSYLQIKSTFTAPDGSTTSQTNNSSGLSNWMGDLGVAYNFTPAFAVGVDVIYARYTVKTNASAGVAASTNSTSPYGVMATATYNFGA